MTDPISRIQCEFHQHRICLLVNTDSRSRTRRITITPITNGGTAVNNIDTYHYPTHASQVLTVATADNKPRISLLQVRDYMVSIAIGGKHQLALPMNIFLTGIKME